jgi:chromosomal replication initiator protein
MLRSGYLDTDKGRRNRARPIQAVLYVVVRVVLRMQHQTQTSIWKPFLQAVERRLGKQAVATWFRPLKVSDSSTPNSLVIAAPNTVIRDWIVSNYSNVLNESLREIALESCRIQWTVLPVPGRPNSGEVKGLVESRNAAIGVHGDVESYPVPAAENRQNTPEPALNTKYTFETFVVGSCNRFAHAAAKAVAEMPGRTYNPLYLYGGVGLGKTHLIQAAGHAIRQANPKLAVAYVSLERFMNELINAIRYGYDKTQAFRERYRTIDVLLIDDVQFITGKERTQEEFFHTFNALYDAQKQIVLTSDCPPRDIPGIEERLHSRFEWGLIADIEPPDLETKIAILKRKAESQQTDLPDDVALVLATHSKHNVRELEGSLVRLLAMASLRGLPLSKTLAQDAVRNVLRREEESGISIRRIQNVVAAQYKVKVDSLVARSNVRHVLLPRQLAMYLCKRLTKKSYPEIGRQFGGKHHTTVMHSVQKIDRLISSDVEIRGTVDKLVEVLEA